MIFLGLSEQTRKALSRTLTRSFQRDHDGDPGVLLLLIGVVLVLIGGYLFYQWLTAPKPAEKPAAEQGDEESGNPLAAGALLALGMIFFLLGVSLDPPAKEGKAGTPPAEHGAAGYMAHRLREKQARASESFVSEDFTVSFPGVFQLPKLARPPRTEFWLGRLELPKLAQGLPALTPWTPKPKLVLTPRNLVETSDYFFERTHSRWWAKSRKIPGESTPAGDGAATGKDGGGPVRK